MTKTLRSLDEHNELRQKLWGPLNESPVPNGIACPQCGEELVDNSPMGILNSYPTKTGIKCPKCGYKGTRIT